MKKIFIALLVLLATQTQAQQIKKAVLQASGLTCSMCSKAVYKSLQAVPFVQEVKSDLVNSAYTLTFKEGSAIDPDALQKAVKDAGFSVASMQLTIHFEKGATVKNDTHITVDGKTFHFLNVPEQTLQGDQQLRIIDKNFVTAKEFKKYSKFTTMKCYETGTMQSCCSKNDAAGQERIYHVTVS